MSGDANTVAILTDTTKCTGCETCVVACKEENGLGKDRMQRWKQKIDDLSNTRFTTIIRRPEGQFVRHQCRHCAEPACASACIVGALEKSEEGPVIYDADKCMGCRYCMMACPYGIPRYDWDKPVPHVRKCTMCYHRVKEGRQPACTEACPEQATIFGTRAELLSIAHERIKQNPDQYVDRVFGETEVGGTSVLYISDIPLGFLGWKPNLPDTPLPKLTWASLTKVPPVIVGMAAAMSGIYFVIGRRMKLQALAALEAKSANSSGAPGAGAEVAADATKNTATPEESANNKDE